MATDYKIVVVPDTGTTTTICKQGIGVTIHSLVLAGFDDSAKLFCCKRKSCLISLDPSCSAHARVNLYMIIAVFMDTSGQSMGNEEKKNRSPP